ncbi:delta-5 desaturase [Xylogone sp. PMI_703]|nr:delta-5 desaturase [Xylogone sp. PMI_703]
MASTVEPITGYTTKELRESVKNGKCLVAVRGYVYDLSGFVRFHPGGASRLNMAAGRDVTVVFETTHDESAFKVLSKYRVGQLLDNEFPTFAPPNQFARTLRTRVNSYFKITGKDPKYAPSALVRQMIPITGIIVCYILLYWSSYVRSSLLATSLLSILWAWCYVGFTVHWVHDSSHSAITHNPKIWDAMGLIYNFVMGYSDIMWFYKHVLGHHPYTNIEGADPDISTEPFSITRFMPSQKWLPIYELQHIYAPILYSQLTHFVKLQDIISYLSGKLDKIHMNPFTKSQIIVFWSGKAFFFVYRCLIPYLYSASSGHRIISTFICTEMMISWMAAFMFESSHVVEDILWPLPEQGGQMSQDWVQLQIETAQDYAHDDWLTTFLTGSLNYQAIHHVFPQINQIYYPEIAGIVKSICDEYGVKYRVRSSILEAFGDHLHLLKKLGVDKR